MTTRADMAHELVLSPSSPTKTFVIEAHTEAPADFLRHTFSAGYVEPTEDVYLYKVHLKDGLLWVDQTDERFWSIHTDMSAGDARALINKEVEAHRELDRIWLPSEHLRNLWPNSVTRRVQTSFQGEGFVGRSDAARDLKVRLSGNNANELLEYISQNQRYRSSVSFQSVQASLDDEDFGSIEEAVSRTGLFAASGDSFEFHVQFVRSVVQRYKNLVLACESRAIGYTSFDENGVEPGGRMVGEPIVVRFAREIEDLSGFVAELLSSRQPYRLWGVPEIVGDYAEVEAVDLHVGSRLRLDIGTDWLRIYLDSGCCGNTVARLVANLQHTFDGALQFVDPGLQAALHARDSVILAGSN